MNKLIKISTFIILIICILLLFISKSLDNVSNSILTILPSSKEKSLLLNYDKLKTSKTIIVSSKGLDKNSYKNIINIDKELSNIKYLSLKQNNSNNFKREYLKKYHLYLNEMNNHKINSLNIQDELSNLYNSLTNSFFPIIINNKDPFNLFENIKTNSVLDIKNSHLIIKDYGYVSFFNIDNKANSLKQYKQIYNEISKIKNRFDNTTIFSPIFYYVENQKAIKDDVNKIVIFATIILFILYVFMIKNFSLLFHTVSALATSIILSTIFLSLFFSHISIFTLVFGISISTVAIDYMFHLYMNDYYVKNKSFNKEVFFGFLTTIIAFFIISFTSFDLIKQISIFAISTLFISYLQFSILFPKIGFIRKKEFEIKINLFKIKSKYISIFSILLILISINFISFDTNLKNLDYDNKKLKSTQEFFNTKLNNKENIKILVEGKSIEQLLKHIEFIKSKVSYTNSNLNLIITKKDFAKTNKILENKEFEKIKEDLKTKSSEYNFRKDFFNDSYKKEDLPDYTIKNLEKLNIDVLRINNNFYISTDIKKADLDLIRNKDFIYVLSFSMLFEKSLQDSKNNLLLLGSITLFIIFIILYMVTKKRFFNAVNFILFPISIILSYSYFVEFNILHIFMIFIILALCIDYGIYFSKDATLQTNKAIAYSLLSTFAGFGVLIFSQINSLKSIGMVTTIAVISITILLIFSKRYKNETNRS